MINYVVTETHAYTLLDYINNWAQDLGKRFTIVPYDFLPRLYAVPPGVYIFSDYERLNGRQRAMTAEFAAQIKASGRALLLNSSEGMMDRLQLLKTLHDRGINPYNVRSMGDQTRSVNPPCFIRRTDDHEGALTDPFADEKTRRRGKLEIIMRGLDPSGLMEIEYCQTKDASGVYRKYSAFRVGSQIIARHLFFSREWMVKETDLVEPQFVAEQFEYIHTNPHEAQLREIFDLARIDYGRIDYGFFNGKIVVWEINTNPLILWSVDRYKPEILPAYRVFADRFRKVIIDLDNQGIALAGKPEPIRINWPQELVDGLVSPDKKW